LTRVLPLLPSLFIIIIISLTSIIDLASIFNYLVTSNLISVKPEISAYAQDSTGNNDGSYINFIDPINLSNNTRDSIYSQIAVYGRNVYVIWEEESATVSNNSIDKSHENRNYDIYFKKSTDGGATFSKGINISNNSGYSEHPQIAVSGSNVYVAWTDNTLLNQEILFKMSTDGGNTFYKSINLSNNSGSSYNQEIAVFANNVYVVWEDKTDNLKNSNNNSGGNNINNVTISTNAVSVNSSIVVKASTDGGNTFKNIKIITNDAGGPVESYPKIAASGSNVYVVWNVGMPSVENNDYNNNIGKEQGIFFTKSSDSGSSFCSIVKLNNQGKIAGESQIAASGNQVYIVWSGNSDNLIPNDLFFIKSTDRGDTFTDEISLRKKSSLNAEISVYGDNVYIPWQDGISKGNNQEILLKQSTDRGDTFTDGIENLSNNNGISECPSIAVSNNNVYVVWEDDTAGNHEIFFTRSYTSYQ
jgi:hypothetical protein